MELRLMRDLNGLDIWAVTQLELDVFKLRHDYSHDAWAHSLDEFMDWMREK